MAKRGALEHPKMLDLAEILGIMDCFAFGVMEAFWHHVAKYHEDGDITGVKPGSLARSMRYTGDGPALLAAMIEAGFVDQSGDRLIVHGWSEHADDATHTRLYRGLKTFADGAIPKPAKIGKEERAKLDAAWAELLSTANTPGGTPAGDLRGPCLSLSLSLSQDIPPNPQGGDGEVSEPVASDPPPKAKRPPRVDHSEGVEVPAELAAIPGFMDAWAERRKQRYASAAKQYPTPECAATELESLLECSDPVAILKRAYSANWQGLGIQDRHKHGGGSGGLAMYQNAYNRAGGQA